MDTNTLNEYADELFIALQADRKINAIKAIRAMTGGGLYEGKAVVEAIFKAFNRPQDFNPYAAVEDNSEYMVTVAGENSTWTHTFASEQAAIDYADGYRNVTVGKVIAKSVAKTVVTYTLERV